MTATTAVTPVITGTPTASAPSARPLAGRTALVTGGSRGIGRGIALRLARDGARVGVHYATNEAAAKETVAAIEDAGGSAFALGADLGARDAVDSLWTAFDAAADGLDILVNNAGVGTSATYETIDAAEYDRLFAVNTRAPFFLTRSGLSRLRDGGRVVNISTGLSHAALMPDLIAYAMTKGALDVFTRTLSKSLGPRGITVNAVAPGVIDTDINAGWLRDSPEAWSVTAASSPFDRVGTSADIADVVAFLASDDARWITGQWLDASGGAIA